MGIWYAYCCLINLLVFFMDPPIAGVSKVWPAGWSRPANVSNPARGALPKNSNMEQKIQTWNEELRNGTKISDMGYMCTCSSY